MKIAVLYGTETGNAEMLADDIASALEDSHDTSVANLQDIAPEALRDAALNIIVCSSYGDGELPASAVPFAERLAAEQPGSKRGAFRHFRSGGCRICRDLRPWLQASGRIADRARRADYRRTAGP